MKIVVLDGYTLNPGDLSYEPLSEFGELTVYEHTKPEETVERIGDAEIVYTNKTLLTRDVIERTNMKWIGVLATGYNVVDVACAREKGIPVTNIPNYGTNSVAQFTFALLLEICHHVGEHSNAVLNGKWSANGRFCFWDYPLIELDGKTLGIIGFGKIGRQVGAIAKVFGMNLIVHDRVVDADMEKQGFKYVDLETLYAAADVISLHCPLFAENERMINRAAIAGMKDGVIIINTSRGGLIDEQDLCDALNSGKVYGAAVDVVSVEPISPQNPLLSAKNCIITPHIAWAPKESRVRLLNIAVDILRSYLGGKLINAVN